MELIEIFSAELGRCYVEQNLELNDVEMEEAFLEDSTILEGELMSLLAQSYGNGINLNKVVWVYGSLRKGEYNNYLLKNSEFVGVSIVSGFKMYSLGLYPFVYQTNNQEDTILVEGYKVDDKTYDIINNMEMVSGYDKITLSTISNGEEINGDMYIMKQMVRYYSEVEGGDWVIEKNRRYLYESGYL